MPAPKSYTSPIQPQTQTNEGHMSGEPLLGSNTADKKKNNCLAGLATCGCILLVVGVFGLMIIRAIVAPYGGWKELYHAEGAVPIESTYTNWETGEKITTTTSMSIAEALRTGIGLIGYLRAMSEADYQALEAKDREELKACLKNELGEARFNEINSGSFPKKSDVPALQTCSQ